MPTTTVAAMQSLISVTEIAKLLGVTRQHVDRLVRTDVNFPSPVAVLSGMRVFDRAAIDRWARQTGRIK